MEIGRSFPKLLRETLIFRGDRLLVAVSGGPDSVALLHLLYELRGEMDLHLEVAHLQHGIRGEESKEDAGFVANLATTLQLPFHLREIDLPRMKRDAGKGNLEALGRAERYKFFSDVMRQRRLSKVATAHTRDDQAETMLMWLLRGAGAKGMGGMAPLQQLDLSGAESGNNLVVVRPLLAASKAELLQYLSERQIGYRIDKTNQDPALLRNWIRGELLPTLENRIDSRVPERLAQVAELLRDEDAVLDHLARGRLKAVEAEDGLSRSIFLSEPKALQRRVLRLWIEQRRGQLRGVEFVHIEEMLRLITQGQPQGYVSIPGGWKLEREYDRLRLIKRPRNWTRICYNYTLEVGTSLTVPQARLEIHSGTVAAPLERMPVSLMDAAFDFDALGGGLSVRNFRRGDRFQPLGMEGHKKVKDLFIERQVPLSIRASWPLLVHGDEILWIPGYGRSEVGRIGARTKTVLEFKARPVPS